MKNVVSIVVGIVVIMAMMLVCAPLLLIFSEGENGEMTIWNAVGMAYAVVLFYVLRFIFNNNNK